MLDKRDGGAPSEPATSSSVRADVLVHPLTVPFEDSISSAGGSSYRHTR